jgi:glucuronate isomerase
LVKLTIKAFLHQEAQNYLKAMTKNFLTDDFLLLNEFGRKLYHDHAKGLPIIDYHCHLSPHDIFSDRQFVNLTQAWLEGDHYKWRAMRALGIAEKFITGNASDKEKFDKWAFTVPYTMRNPLYHWTHLELKRYFGVGTLLKPETATSIFEDVSSQLNTRDFSTRNLLKKMNVRLVGTTDDPADSLEDHQKLSGEKFDIRILPTFRPDKAYAIEDASTYKSYLERLGKTAKVTISSFDVLLDTLKARIDFFDANGCRLADHGLDCISADGSPADSNPERTFRKVMRNEKATHEETASYKYALLLELGKLYHAKNWTQQFHLGALRNTRARMMRMLGPDSGFDSIGDFSQARGLARLLNELDSTDQLTRTILYNLNPADNEVIATMTGNFNDGSVKGKVQFGSAWWFLDQKDGMEKQLNTLSNLGLLSCFVGMITDSRSFLSYPRHEYFRRILCNVIGKDIENGELPWDEAWLGKIVSDICYHNAVAYFKFFEHNGHDRSG